jgi:hypothetical protein
MKLLLAVFITMLSLNVWADPSFTSITDDDFTNITKEMSANFTHNSMLGASKLGSIFGFQLGVTLAQTASPKTNEIVKRNAGSELPNLYNGGLIGVLGVPFGIALEAVIFPKNGIAGASMSSTSLAVKWNINDVIPVWPVNLALRGLYSTAGFSFEQDMSGVLASVDNKTSVTGLQLLLSPMIPIVEPYVGVGYLNGTNELTVTGTGSTIFAPSFSSSQSEKKSVSSMQVLGGVEFSLLLIKFGAEYSQSFGASRFGIKLALGF